jgi:hypothetical protein
LDVDVGKMLEHDGEFTDLELVVVPCLCRSVGEDGGVGQVVVIVDNIR